MIKNMLNKKDLLYILSFGVLCLALFVFGIVFVLTSDLKGLQNDAMRINDFSEIRYNAQTFLSNKSRLPRDMKELDDSNYGTRTSYYSGSSSTKSLYKDPKTKEYYDFKPATDNKSFEICTTFEADSTKQQYTTYSYKKGYDCVKINIDSYYLDGIKAID